MHNCASLIQALRPETGGEGSPLLLSTRRTWRRQPRRLQKPAMPQLPGCGTIKPSAPATSASVNHTKHFSKHSRHQENIIFPGRVLPVGFNHKISWLQRDSYKFSNSLTNTLINFSVFLLVGNLEDFSYIKHTLVATSKHAKLTPVLASKIINLTLRNKTSPQTNNKCICSVVTEKTHFLIRLCKRDTHQRNLVLPHLGFGMCSQCGCAEVEPGSSARSG